MNYGLKGTSDVTLYFTRFKFIVKDYVDLDFISDLDKIICSTSYGFKLVRGAESWLSKLQTIAILSTIKVEYMEATQTYKEVIWIQRLMEELKHNQ